MHVLHGERFIGQSAAVRDVLEDIACAASTDAKVLITGESGVGKEVVAHLVHGGSRRAAAPFVTLNCAGVPETLLESELFGHTRGSFTGAVRDRGGLLEMAHGGTLFMDEVGEMSLRMQALLLRFLEHGEIQRVGASERHAIVNVRLVTATNRDLMRQIRDGAFREDLYYRLNVIHVAIPPLRQRREDVALLAQHFVARYAGEYGVAALPLPPETLDCLCRYAWPGNVRELRNVIERVMVRVRERPIAVADLPAEVVRREHAAAPLASAPAAAVPTSRAEFLYDRMIFGREPFWSVVYDPFMDRDLTRDDLRGLITKGLHETRGNYVMLVRLFNLDHRDYKRFLNFLQKHGCHVPVAPFRAGAIRRPAPLLPGQAGGTPPA